MSEHDRDHDIEAARLATLLPAARKSFLTSVLSISVFSALLFRFSPVGLSLWIALRAFVSIIAVAILAKLATASLSVQHERRVLEAVLATSGVVWGLIPVFVQPRDPEWRAVIVLWLFGNQAVITAVCSASRSVFRAAAGSVTIGGALAIASAGDSFGLVLAALLLLGGLYSSSIASSIHRVVTAAIEGQLATADLAASLAQRQEELEAANRELGELARRDGLTRLPNRWCFTELVADGDGRIRATGWLGFIDLDRFKSINDTRGHGVGDLVLITVADRWSSLLPQGAVLARTGGDEFALFVPGETEAGAAELSQRLIRSLDEPIDLADTSSISVSCSIGLCQARPGTSFSTIMARADAALYQVKTDGRNGVHIVDDADRSLGTTSSVDGITRARQTEGSAPQ